MSDRPTSGDDDRLVHLGLLYDAPEELVAVVTPHLRAALDRGDPVTMIVDRLVAGLVRAGLGAAGDHIAFPPTETVPDGPAFLRLLRSAARRDRRTLVVGQYSAVPADDRSCALREDGVNLVLSDLPLTLVCACSRTAGPTTTATAGRTHPALIVDGSALENPGFRPPAACSPVPARTWGPPAVRVLFRDTGDLNRVREQVARVAGEAGLRGDDLRAVVLAVHEATVLVARPGRGPDHRPAGHRLAVHGDGDQGLGSTGDEDCVLEIRTSARSMYSEVRGPRPAAAPEQDPDAAGGPGPATLPLLRRYCRHSTIDDSGDTRVVRVLTDLGGDRPHG